MDTTSKRDRRTGQYTYINKWERICKVCGNTLGNHSAEKPHDNYDLSMGPECPGFKLMRTKERSNLSQKTLQ